MLYSSLEMSESLAYPLCLFAIWAMLAAIRSPSRRGDAVVLGLCLLCTAARLQFIVLLPAALVAVAVAAAVARDRPGSAPRRVLAGLRAHGLLSAATAGLVLLAGAAIAGTAALSLAGRYANQDTVPIPSPWIIVKLVSWHLAGLVLTVAVIPFAGTLLAAWVWLRGGRSRPEVTAFAAVSLSVTAAIVLITAGASYGQSYVHPGAGGDLPRIHERYMFYVLPLFLVAMLATTRLPRSVRLLRAGAVAALLTGLLPLIIPWRTVMNFTISADTFSFTPFAALGAARRPQGSTARRAGRRSLRTLFGVHLRACAAEDRDHRRDRRSVVYLDLCDRAGAARRASSLGDCQLAPGEP